MVDFCQKFEGNMKNYCEIHVLLLVFDAICSSASYGSGWTGESSEFASLFCLRQGCPVGATRKHSEGRWFSSGTAEIWEDTWIYLGPTRSGEEHIVLSVGRVCVYI
jgi:hypothetical protein